MLHRHHLLLGGSRQFFQLCSLPYILCQGWQQQLDLCFLPLSVLREWGNVPQRCDLDSWRYAGWWRVLPCCSQENIKFFKGTYLIPVVFEEEKQELYAPQGAIEFRTVRIVVASGKEFGPPQPN